MEAETKEEGSEVLSSSGLVRDTGLMGESLSSDLGNPGRKYDRTRHNLGFLVVDRLAADEQIAIKKSATLW